MEFGRKVFSFIFILLLGLPNVNSEGATDSIPLEPIGSRGTIIVNASGGGDYRHIQWAIDNASEGDTVYVEAGTYYENLVINKTINLTGSGWEYTTIDGGRMRNVIYISADWVNVSGCTITNTSIGYLPNPNCGIELNNAHFFRIERCKIVNSSYGIYLKSSNKNYLENNILNSNTYGIFIHESSNTMIINNNCSENGVSIYLQNSYDNIVKNNICSEIDLELSYNNIIDNNTCNSIYFLNSIKNNISHNICSNKHNGIYLYSSHANVINNNICTSNGGNGIRLSGSSNNSIQYNFCNANSKYGIQIDPESNHNSINNNTCNSNNETGIYLCNSHSNEISNNTCNMNTWRGVYLAQSNYNRIVNNIGCMNNMQGICLYSSNSNILDKNICNSNIEDGIDMMEANSNVIANNIILSNGYDGICLDTSLRNTILNNIMEKSGLSIIGDLFEHWSSHTIDTLNTINGRPIYYWKNITDGIIPKGAGQVILFNCTNVGVEDQDLCNSSMGIILAYSMCTQIVNNTASSNTGEGIRLWHSSSSNILNNTFNNNKHGISLYHSWNNIIVNNTCNSSMENGIFSYRSNNNITNNTCNLNNEYGIFLQISDSNLIAENTITKNNKDGIHIEDSDRNTIVNNTCISNFNYSISLSLWCDNNTIYKNKFSKNNKGNTQALDDGTNNIWNISNKGNYWSDWTEPDINVDGIVDVPYIIDGNSNCKDYYPLVAPFEMIIPIAEAGNDVVTEQHQTVIFNSSGCFYSAFIVNYTWNFTYDSKPQFRYGPLSGFMFKIPGIYTITLKIINFLGEGTKDTMTVSVRDITLPVADAGPNITINQSETVDFFFHQNSTDNVRCWNWKWTFEYNGTIQTLNHLLIMSSLPFFTFEIPGHYVVSMSVTDEAGNWAIDTLNVTVLDNEPPEAHAGDDYTINTTTPFHFDGSGSRDNKGIVNYTWTFEYNGRTFTLYGPDPFFKFEIPGDYLVTLNVTDSQGNSARDLLLITVHPIDDEISPDDTDPTGDEEQEKETSTYILGTIILLAFLIAIAGIFILFLRKQKTQDQTEGDEFGRTDQKDRPVVEEEDEDDDTQWKNE